MLVQVNVPFAFDTDSEHFAAGVYTIRTENEHILRFQGKSQSELVMTWVEDNAQQASKGKAMFQKYGEQLLPERDFDRFHFPMQKVEKIRFKMSSLVVSPVSESR